MRGIRGAITVEKNKSENIIAAASRLIKEIIETNQVSTEEIVSIIFTATKDLNQEYPAVAARKLGYKNIPLMCYQELNVENSLSKCIRVMIYINRSSDPEAINHVYLKKAKSLRPDLVE